ncbi:MAG: ATP-binding protein [Terriglobales bacterium]
MSRPVSKLSRSHSHESATHFLEAAANACPHGLMVEKAGRVAYANPAFAHMVGFNTPSQVLSRRLDRLPKPHIASKRRSAQGANDAEQLDSMRLQFRGGASDLALHVVRDVSERIRLERRLRESEKMEALGRLVGGVAHDFNNVLTAITLYADLLLEGAPPQRRREAEEIHLAAQRGTSLVRQLLAFARQQPLAPRVLSLGSIVVSMRGMLEPLLGEDIELVTNLDSNHDTVRVDPAQMQQVLLNLVMNARDALPQGGQVKIETGACPIHARSARRYPGLRPGRYVRLVVTDNGCGMDEQVRARLFEPFFTTKKLGEGTGLGMAMVYGIVTQSGGMLWAASKVGKGTRVTVLLPVAQAEIVGDDDSPVAAGAANGTETILVVEDDPAVRASVAHLLAHGGYRVLQARDGEQAIRLARAHTGAIDLLISDVIMPDMNGSDTARHIQHLHPGIAVLFISGYPAAARSASTGAPLLYKPFSRAVLAQKVREILDHRSRAAALAAH